MSDLRKAAEMALEALENPWDAKPEGVADAIQAIRQALAQPEQKPAAWVYNGILHEFDPSEFATSEVTPLYTAPPKREWVGLTDEEIDGLWKMAQMFRAHKHFYLLVEAKLKEKNT